MSPAVTAMTKAAATAVRLCLWPTVRIRDIKQLKQLHGQRAAAAAAAALEFAYDFVRESSISHQHYLLARPYEE